MKGFNEPELRPPGGSGLKRETSPESLFSFARNPLEEHRVVNKKNGTALRGPVFYCITWFRRYGRRHRRDLGGCSYDHRADDRGQLCRSAHQDEPG